MKNTIKKLLASALLAIPGCQLHSTQQFSDIDEQATLKKNFITYPTYQNLMKTMTDNMDDEDVIVVFTQAPQPNQQLKLELQDDSQQPEGAVAISLPKELKNIDNAINGLRGKNPNTTKLRKAIVDAAQSKDKLIVSYMRYAINDSLDFGIIEQLPNDINDLKNAQTYEDETIVLLAQHILDASTNNESANPLRPIGGANTTVTAPENENVIIFTKPQLLKQTASKYFQQITANGQDSKPHFVKEDDMPEDSFIGILRKYGYAAHYKAPKLKATKLQGGNNAIDLQAYKTARDNIYKMLGNMADNNPATVVAKNDNLFGAYIDALTANMQVNDTDTKIIQNALGLTEDQAKATLRTDFLNKFNGTGTVEQLKEAIEAIEAKIDFGEPEDATDTTKNTYNHFQKNETFTDALARLTIQ